MGFRENTMTVAERLKDVITRNYKGKDFEIQYRPDETYIAFLRDQWSRSDFEGIFAYLGIHLKDWLKYWDISLHFQHYHWIEGNSDNNQIFEYWPKEIITFWIDCPMKDDAKCDYPSCDTCKLNVALVPICKIQLFIKPELKECKHSLVENKNWNMLICEHCGFMEHIKKKQE